MPKTEVFNREDVLNRAITVFHTKGYNATSMQDLVDATGLNRSSIYNTFDNKLNLFLECLKLYQSNYQRLTSNILLNASTGLNAIRSIFDMHLNDVQCTKVNKGCMIVNCKSEMANQEPAINHFLRSNQNDTLLLFEDLITKGKTDHSITTEVTTKALALYLYSALQGFRMTSILVNEKDELQGIINNTMHRLN